MPLTIELLRPDDLVSLWVEAHNWRLNTTARSRPRLVRENPDAPAFIVVVFPPQAFAEQVFWESNGSKEAAPPPGDVRSRMSGPTRLAFKVPADVESIPYSIDALLDWSGFEPSLAPVAEVAGRPAFIRAGPPVAAPSATQTGIELPYRLVISPGLDARWRHARRPATRNGRTELWHTRLVIPNVSAVTRDTLAEIREGNEAEFRAIWSPDYTGGPSPTAATNDKPFPMSLQPLDRHQLVVMTSSFPSGPLMRWSDLGTPVRARRLMLSALGGYLDADGSWPTPPAGVSLTRWGHIAALGRDQCVRVERLGRLFPFMHRATKVTITERRFETWPPDMPSIGQPVAYLRKYQFIIVNERELSYEDAPFASQGREMPLSRLVRINTVATPKLDPEVLIARAPPGGGPVITTFSREVRVGGSLFPFSLTAMDLSGNSVDFTAGLIFVQEEDLQQNLDIIADHYRNAISEADRAAAVANQRVTLAPSAPGSDTTTFLTSAFHFDVQLGRGQAGLLPLIRKVDVRVPSVETLTGKRTAASITFYQPYLAAGFDAAAGVFAEIAGAATLPVEFSADQAGGIARPDLSVSGFSRTVGPVAGKLAEAAAGTIDPGAAFAGAGATLFGAIPIKDIVGSLDFAEVSPRITTELLPTPAAPVEVMTRMAWSVKPKSNSIAGVTFEPSAASLLTIDVTAVRPLQPGPEPRTETAGKLNDFKVTLKGVIRLSFKEFRFGSGNGRKTSVDVELADGMPIEFLGALEFISKLTAIIPPGIFGDNGPKLELKPDRIEVGFGLGLPPAALGVFSIRNIAIGTKLALPFLSGKPSFSFGFATREKPFQLAVLILGGGGFFRLEVDTERVLVVEGMLEFGGVVALNVGVASGSVSIMAGIYFAIRSDESELTGFVAVHGEVTVLAIASASVDFNLSLTYYDQAKIAKGVATVSVSIRIAFVSRSVSFSVERSFSGGSAHLSIGSAMSSDDWRGYAEAFG